jgi:serine/threonine-protein kinase
MLCDEIAAGGMATVHFGRLLGPVGFSRTVAIKRLHPQLARDPDFVAMFVDEARLAARIRHPNVVPTLDVVATEGELFLVMDYVPGESLSRLLRASRASGLVPPRIASAIFCGALHGLHAAHEATDERGKPLGIVHRDMSPQNILIGSDGVPRVLDFGVAMAAGRAQATGPGKIKGKLGYLAPEQVAGTVTRQSDLFAVAVALWEVLTGKRLFQGDDPRQVIGRILTAEILPPSKLARQLPPGIDAVVMRGLERDPLRRYATAREMAMKLEECIEPASPTQVGQWVDSTAHAALAKRGATLAAIENSSSRALEADANAASASSHVFPGSGTSLAGFEGSDSVEPSSEYSLPSRRDARDMTTAGHGTRRTTGARRSWSWIIGAAFLLTVAAAFLFVRRLERPAADVVHGPGAREVATASASAAPPGPSGEPPPTVPSAPPASAEPTARATASAAPTAARGSGREAGEGSTGTAGTRTVRSVPPPVKRAVVTLDCDPPYSLDAQGHKIWKDECFRKPAP